MDAAEVLATGVVAIVSGGVGAWLNHVIGASERREQRKAEDQRAAQTRIREFRLGQLDDTADYCLDALDTIKALTAPPPVPLKFPPPRATDVYLFADADLLERFSWVVEQAEIGIFPGPRSDQLELDTLRGQVRRTWTIQRERLLRNQGLNRLSQEVADPVFDRVVAAREAILGGRADRTWCPSPPQMTASTPGSPPS